MAGSDPPWTILVPGDPGQLTGGYGYVREIASGLMHLGQPVDLKGLPGRFPRGDQQASLALDGALAGLPDGATAIVDGLALGGCPEPAERHGKRLDLVALVHHPLADETGISAENQRHFFETERRALALVRRVVTTSHTTTRGLARYGVLPERIVTVPPGVHRPVAVVSDSQWGPEPLRILCLAHLSPRKAQQHLVDALARLPRNGWECQLAGSVARDPAYAGLVGQSIQEHGLTEQIRLTGELTDAERHQAFLWANLFVLPSLHEGYGMVIDEALAYGLPVITSNGGALASTADRPGCIMYRAGDIEALSSLLAKRSAEPALLGEQRRQAVAGARQLRNWAQAAEEFRQAIASAPRSGSLFDAGWLTLREPADHAARSTVLTSQAIDWLARHTYVAPVIADIGAGTGSNWRYLSRAMARRHMAGFEWHLFDQDPELLSHGGLRSDDVHRHTRRLEVSNLDDCLPPSARLVTASALIDLVSPEWLDALAGAASARLAAVLVVLSYAGHFRLTPEHQADEDLRRLVNEHQHGDKGTGAACGPEATSRLASSLRTHGYEVRCEPSPWQLAGDQSALQTQLIKGWAEAAHHQLALAGESDQACPEWLDDWLSLRLAQARQGALVIEVDHMDLLGVPVP